MDVDEQFPLPFEFVPAADRSQDGRATKFVVAGMYTPSHADRAERLRRSCEQFGLAYTLYELPTIHKSISVKGSPDLEFTKPNFIRHVIDRHGMPILYVDIDCVFRAYPTLIAELVDKRTSFSVYNWLADVDNEAFYPINVRLNGKLIEDRFFDYSHRMPFFSTSQLVCSGCAQLFDTSSSAADLLKLWHETIMRFPDSPDDQCLGFAFNNGGARARDFRYSWLPKEYARYAWWIFTKPVIDHAELPGLTNVGHKDIPMTPHVKHFYAESCEPTEARFAENSVIDVKDRLLYALADRRLTLIGPLEADLWISDEICAPVTIDVVEIQ